MTLIIWRGLVRYFADSSSFGIVWCYAHDWFEMEGQSTEVMCPSSHSINHFGVCYFPAGRRLGCCFIWIQLQQDPWTHFSPPACFLAELEGVEGVVSVVGMSHLFLHLDLVLLVQAFISGLPHFFLSAQIISVYGWSPLLVHLETEADWRSTTYYSVSSLCNSVTQGLNCPLVAPLPFLFYSRSC